MLSILRSPRATFHRDTIYWHYPLKKPHFLGGQSSRAIRKGDWKLIEFYDTGRIELYNLADDIGEERNLVARFPKLAKQLDEKLEKWLSEVDARLPTRGKP